MSVSLDKPETASFSFHVGNDLSNVDKNLPKKSSYSHSTCWPNLIERYKQNELQVAVVCRPRPQGHEYHLLFSAIPNRGSRQFKEASSLEINPRLKETSSHGSDDSVFICVTEQVKCPQELISSVVRFQVAKERVNFLRDILAPSLDGCFKSFGISGEGEVGVLGITIPRCGSDRETGVIQSGAEIGNSVSSDVLDSWGNRLSQFDLMKLVSRSIRIIFDNLFVSASIDESADCYCQIIDMFLSPYDLTTRAIERI